MSDDRKQSIDDWTFEFIQDVLSFRQAVHEKMKTEPRFVKAMLYPHWESTFGSWTNEHKGWLLSSTLEGSILDYQLETEDEKN